MIIGSVKEIKENENRVALIPDHVSEFVKAGHQVYVQKDLGLGSGYSNKAYEDCGAILCEEARDVWSRVDLMVKIKEPLPSEYQYFRDDLTIFTYLHLANNHDLAQALLKANTTSLAYETVEDLRKGLPLLKPMSEVAGRLSIQEGSKYLEKTYGGKGVLLSGVPGVRSGHVVIIGAGVVGANAAKTALGTGASVSILDKNIDRLAYLDDVFKGRVETIYSTEASIVEELRRADVVIGSVLLPGASTPKLVRKEHLDLMEKGSVLVDVAIDQGGCFETSRMTHHDDPVYIEKGIVHYCVGNMPGAVPKTSTRALVNASFPYIMKLANLGLEKAVEKDPGLKKGLTTYRGYLVHQAVAQSLGLSFTEYDKIEKIMQV